MKTAQEIYDHLLNTKLTTPTQLCSLHAPCAKEVNRCNNQQHYPVLDFDQIKNKWRKQNGQPSTLSVDALTYKEENIYFVEIKGWKKFLAYQSANETSIQKQVDSYNLQGKLLDSASLCEEITGEADILKNVPAIYVLVTDINIKEQGLESIATNLSLLGATTTDWETVCNKYLGKSLRSIQRIQTRYITCAEFDNLFK